MFIEIFTAAQWRRANPAISGPQSGVLIQAPSNPGANDALIESIGVFQQTQVTIKPPLQSTVWILSKLALGKHSIPLTDIIDRLGDRLV